MSRFLLVVALALVTGCLTPAPQPPPNDADAADVDGKHAEVDDAVNCKAMCIALAALPCQEHDAGCVATCEQEIAERLTTVHPLCVSHAKSPAAVVACRSSVRCTPVKP